jgi:hypothetical protein
MLLLPILGCGEPGPGAAPSLLAPPPAGQGVQIKLLSALDPGSMAERCLFYQVPAGGLYVSREEIRYTSGCHHVMLWKTAYTEIPTATIHGEAVDTSGVFDCGQNGAMGDWEIVGVAGGAQAAEGTAAVQGLPGDTALKFEGGSVLLVGASYMNAGTKPLVPEIDINLYTVPPAQVTREAGILFLYDPFIFVAGESKSAAREVCPIQADITLLNAQSHMHARGYQFVADLDGADGTTKQELFATQSWQYVTSQPMDPPLALTAGDTIDVRCDYWNNETRTVVQGGTMDDEMCVFLGLYYPKDAQTELCSIMADGGGRYLGARWIGSGAADGAATAACLRAATGPAAAASDIDACVVGACPPISAETSNATRCLASRGLGQCAAACGGADTAACEACVSETCSPAMTALAVAACS